jgi:hypothetical protein
MPTPIITLPIHTIEQARALAGLLRAFIDDQQPDTNDGADWKPDPDLAGIAALYAHLDAGIAAATSMPAPSGFSDNSTIEGDSSTMRW